MDKMNVTEVTIDKEVIYQCKSKQEQKRKKPLSAAQTVGAIIMTFSLFLSFLFTLSQNFALNELISIISTV